MLYKEETIAAIVTAPYRAAVSIIRVSGKEALPLVRLISDISDEYQFLARTFKLARIRDPDTGKNIDQVIVLFFQNPYSYTGEDVVEIQMHGSTWISHRVLELLLKLGARLAKPGEFTQRALLNGKIDLSQSEAILDLINANSEHSAQNALALYDGKLGQFIKSMRSELMELLSSLIACIDFPDEVEEYPISKFKDIIINSILGIDTLLNSENRGRILREGLKLAVVGKPNVGKSSLMNCLLDTDRAIVTDIAGTTRDTIEEELNLGGYPVILIDTAGIHESNDIVENIGIQKSFEALENADLVILLNDLTQPSIENHLEHIISKYKVLNKPIIIVGTKLDLISPDMINQTKEFDICISSHTQENIIKFEKLIVEKIEEYIQTKDIDNSKDTISINKRQADLLRVAKISLEESIKTAEQNLDYDFLTIDLQIAISKLGELTGEDLKEEVLDTMFSKFCIGK